MKTTAIQTPAACRKHFNQPRRRAALFAAVLLLAGLPAVWAANGNDTWQGGASGTSTNFSVGANWASGSANQPPLSGDSLFFGAAGANGATLYGDQSGFTYAGITFNSGASAFTIHGNSFTLGGGITNNSTSLQTVTNAISLGSSTPTVAMSTGGVTLTGPLSNGGLATAGSGTLTLSNLNSTFAGGISLTTGTLAIGVNSTPLSGAVTSGPLGTGTLTLGGGTLTVNTTIATVTNANAISVTGGTTTTVFSTNGNLYLSGTITGSGTITNNTSAGATTAFLGDISGFTGTFGYNNVVAGNNFRFNGTTANNQNGSQAHFVLTGSTASGSRAFGFGNTTSPVFQMGELSGTGGYLNNLGIAGATLQVGALNTSTTFGGVIADNNSTYKTALVKVGAGSLTLTGANTYSNSTAIQNGMVILSGGNNRLTAATSVTLGAASTSGVLQLGNSSSAVNQTLAGLATTGMGGSVVGGNASVSVLTLNLTGTTTFGSTLGGAGANQNNLALTKTNTGTLILSGANTFSGGVNISNGVIKVNGTEMPGTSGPLGSAGTISFGGGTLQYSAANSADYSSRFSTVGGQAFKVDVNGQSVTFASPLNNAGGTLTLSDSAATGTSMLMLSGSYNCPVTVSSGRLTVASSQTGAAAVSVSDGANLRVTVSGASQWSPTTLTLGASTGGTLEFNGLANTSPAPLNPTTVNVNGTAMVNINSGTGLVVGGVYPLVANWGAGAFNLVAQPAGVQGALSVSSGTLVYTVTAVSDIWNANNPGGNWDVGVTANWSGNAVNNTPLDTYRDGDAVAFTDTVTGPNTVTNAANVAPSSIAVGNSSTAYTITSDGTHNIGGSGTLTKSGSAALTLSGNNSYSGGTTLSAGQLNIDNGGSSSANSAIGTGSLTIAGSSAIDNISGADVTLQPAIAQNWNASFTYVGSANNLNLGAGTVALGTSPTVTVNSNTLTVGGAISATSYGLTKAGGGTLVLSGANAYTGTNTVSGGTLKAGVASVANTSGAFGNNTAVALANTAGATLDITGFNTQIGSLTGGGTNGGNVILGTKMLTVGADNTSPAAYAGVISDTSGGGSLTIIGNGTLTLSGANTYGGGTTLNGGTLALGASSTTNSSGAVTNGPLGTNTLTLSGGTLNCGTNTTMANAIYVTPSTTTAVFSPNTQSILTGALTGSGTISNNYSAASTLAIQGDISGFTGTFSYYLNSGGNNFRFNAGLAGNQNGSQAHFIINGATSGRAFGIGGAGFATFQMGDLSGTGGVINNMNVNGSLTTLQVGALNTSTTFGGIIIDNSSDKTALTKVGTGTLTLSGANTFSGGLTVTNGYVSFASDATSGGQPLGGYPASVSAANVTLNGGGLFATSSTTIAVNRGITLGTNGGTLDASAGQTLTVNSAVAGGALTKGINTGTVTLSANNYQGNTTVNGGTLSLAQPTLSTTSTVSITNGAVLQLAFAGGQTNPVAVLVLNGTNQPAGVYDSTTPGGYLAGSTGYLLVVPPVTINPHPPVLQVSYGAGSLNLGWPTNQGWILQTNSVGLAATNAWFNYPPDGLVTATNVTITVNPANANVFYRMVYP